MKYADDAINGWLIAYGHANVVFKVNDARGLGLGQLRTIVINHLSASV